jgi:hypothetical protein
MLYVKERKIMRNITEYPVTADEAISALQIAFENRSKNIGKYGFGDIDGIALLMAEKFIENNKERFDTFAKASLEIIFEGNE